MFERTVYLVDNSDIPL